MAKKNNKKNKNKQNNKQKVKFRFTKANLITQIANEGGVTITETQAFYNIFEKVLTEAITNYSEVTLSIKLGKFILKTVPAGRLTTPKGKKMTYPAHTSVRFKVSNALKRIVKDIKLA